ncbi:MAG TPA: hypothetical protein VGE74_31955, partial [Gemmata sp.]
PTATGSNSPERKKLLLVAYLLRQLADQITHPVFLEAIEAGEKYADGLISHSEMWAVEERAAEVYDSRAFRPRAAQDAAIFAQRYLYEQNETSEMVVWAFASRAVRLSKARGKRAEEVRSKAGAEMKALIRRLINEVHGNPFRPVTFAPEWRTETAVALAHQMYESRDFSAMPILADALQDAGCDHPDALAHCRDANQLHIRGCWVVDLVLGMV